MTTKCRLTSLSAENCTVEIHSVMQELCLFQLKTHRLSTLFHQKTKKQKNMAKNKQSQKNCVFTSLFSIQSSKSSNSMNTSALVHVLRYLQKVESLV